MAKILQFNRNKTKEKFLEKWNRIADSYNGESISQELLDRVEHDYELFQQEFANLANGVVQQLFQKNFISYHVNIIRHDWFALNCTFQETIAYLRSRMQFNAEELAEQQQKYKELFNEYWTDRDYKTN